MRVTKILAVVLLVYVAFVAAFESMIGYTQPAGGSTLVITTFGADGSAHDRVVSRLESDGQLYVAANHWPRAWYRRALRNPQVRVTVDGESRDHRAVPVSEEEGARVMEAHPLGLGFRFMTGFPPRDLLRLEPHQAGGDAPSPGTDR